MFNHRLCPVAPRSTTGAQLEIERGRVTELSGAPSSGKSTWAFQLCLRALARGDAAAWIGPRNGFWPLAALEAGVALDRLLVVHLDEGLSALRAAQLVLACPSAVAALVVDLPRAFRPGNAQLQKLQRLAERSGTALVFLTERGPGAPSLGPAVALRLHLRSRGNGLARRISAEVLRHKHGATQQIVEESDHGPDRLRIRGSL